MKFEFIIQSLQSLGYDLEFTSNNYIVNATLYKGGEFIKSGLGISSEEAFAELLTKDSIIKNIPFPGLSEL